MRYRTPQAQYLAVLLLLFSLLLGSLAPWDHGGVESTPPPTPTATLVQ
jgi:hypothetical protein